MFEPQLKLLNNSLSVTIMDYIPDQNGTRLIGEYNASVERGGLLPDVLSGDQIRLK